jgi:hypothetical protein
VLPQGFGHAWGQGHFTDLAALGKREAQLRPHHLDLAPDVDDFRLEVDVLRSQTERLSLAEAKAGTDLDEDPVALGQSCAYRQNPLGRPLLNPTRCSRRRADRTRAARVACKSTVFDGSCSTPDSVAQTRRIEVGPRSFSSRFFQLRSASVPTLLSGSAPRCGTMCRRTRRWRRSRPARCLTVRVDSSRRHW